MVNNLPLKIINDINNLYIPVPVYLYSHIPKCGLYVGIYGIHCKTKSSHVEVAIDISGQFSCLN